MGDFSAAAILRLVPLGLKRQGIDMSVQAAPKTAHMAIGDKRQLLQAIATAHGEHALVRLGEGILDAPDEPVLTAMSFARDPRELVVRWQRLERYIHSNHRVTVDRSDDTHMLVRHLSLKGTAAPHRHEDLLILGLLIGLLQWIGSQGLKARLAGESAWRYHDCQWRAKRWPPSVESWEFEWTSSQANALVPGVAGGEQRRPAPNDCIADARNRLSADPARPWTVAALAKEMNMATRSLQRNLAHEKSSFSALLAQARAASAAHALISTEQSPAQIGYACGYADQAHFGRDFKRHTALTPLQYRAEFTARIGRACNTA